MATIKKPMWHAKLFEVKRYFSLNVICNTPQEAEDAIKELHKKGKLKPEIPGPDEIVIMVAPGTVEITPIKKPDPKSPTNGGHRKGH